jgi:hypothetical protein
MTHTKSKAPKLIAIGTKMLGDFYFSSIFCQTRLIEVVVPQGLLENDCLYIESAQRVYNVAPGADALASL